MPTKFNLSSNHWILLSIVLLGLSSYPYNQLKTQKDNIDSRARAAVQKAKKEEQNASALETDLRKAKVAPTAADSKPLTLKFQEFIYGIKAVGAQYGADVTAIVAKDGRSLSSTARELNAVAVPLTAAPGVKVVTVEVKGKFKSADDLKKFFDFLAAQNLAIANVVVARDAFSVTVDIYGV